MTVTKNVYDNYMLLTGTAAEVVEQLSDDNIPQSAYQIFFNGTNVSAAIRK